MRTRLGEIELGKIIIALFLVSLWTLVCCSTINGLDDISYAFNLDLKDYFIGFLTYLFLLISGLVVMVYEAMTKLNVPGFGSSTDRDKDIIKLKEKGYYIYQRGSGFNPIENETRHLSRDTVNELDRFVYRYGPPFGDIWEFDCGVVFWFGMLPFLGGMVLLFCVGLPLIGIAIIYNFFF